MDARRPPTFDLALAAACILIGQFHIGSDPAPGPALFARVALLLVALPVAFRQIAPLEAAAISSAGVAVPAIVLARVPEGLMYVLPLNVLMYSVAAYATRRRAAAGLVVILAGAAIQSVFDQKIHGQAAVWAFAFWSLALLMSWVAGLAMRSRRERRASEQRAVAAELARETEVHAAAERERARIARELHDVIAHSVSVMGVQASAAEQVLGSQPESARDPLAAIQTTARETIVELRRMLGALREGSEDDALTPQPGLAQLEPLLQQVRASGLVVDLAIRGDATPLPAGLDLSAYRIVQEALTNSLKHARATRVEVALSYEPRNLEICVRDDGRGSARSRNGHVGRGLVGIRERVALFGGELRTGDRSGGGFEVWTRLPIDGAA